MKLLYRYLRNYRGLIALALTLAAINQVFSLLDPLIFRHVIDEYVQAEWHATEMERLVMFGQALGRSLDIDTIRDVVPSSCRSSPAPTMPG